MMADEQATHTHTNRLIDETSPYLLQHAHDPVDWHPWGRDAFERAKREDKPVFLSIGYSTCHWCHVMERESFEDEATAELLNRNFVSIKVDREQRPDVDETYMKAVQIMTGSGGWPLSVFLTPDGEPFYGGTYFPPRAGFGRPSFTQVLQSIGDAWRDRREQLLQSAQELTQALRGLAEPGAEGRLSPSVLDDAFAALSGYFDKTHGGFGHAPKFPQPSTLMLLSNYWRRTGSQGALGMVEKTLDTMAHGGIHDHLGGGFHRYATDAQWLIPHFEKMLYDQALLSRVYVQAYQVTKNPAYAAVARDIFRYVLRDMRDPDGGFYAAEDADSEGREGAFYLWRREEIEQVLSAEQAEVFCRYYGVTDKGNSDGENVLHVAASVERLGVEFGRNPEEIKTDLAQARKRLFERRNTRPRPHRDDKIITAWNGLMISSFAYAGAVLGEREYVEAARNAAEFILHLLRQEGRLMRSFRARRVTDKGFLEDYAFLIIGLIDLYEASFEVRWLREAKALAEQMISLFADAAEGGFFLTGHDAERLITRDKPSYDGAVPSGNSAAALALLKLGTLFMESRFTEEAKRILGRFSGEMAGSPTSLTSMLLALDYQLGPAQEIVIAGAGASSESQMLVEEVRRHFLPNAAVMFHGTGDEGEALVQEVPFVANLVPVKGHAAAYVCEKYACRQPITTREALREVLTGIAGRGSTIDSG